jgi:hypothetical protein
MSAPAIRAALAYFALVFAAGFALGVVRVGWAVGRFGERAAELAELPLMLAVSWLAAGWALGRFAVPARWVPRLAVGGLALALLVACELTIVLGVRGLSVGEYLGTRDPIAGSAYLLSLLAYASMPALRIFVDRAARADSPRPG